MSGRSFLVGWRLLRKNRGDAEVAENGTEEVLVRLVMVNLCLFFIYKFTANIIIGWAGGGRGVRSFA